MNVTEKLLSLIPSSAMAADIAIVAQAFYDAPQPAQRPTRRGEKRMSKADTWIAGDDTGISSRTIWAVMRGVPANRWASPPLDPSDFARCCRLLSLMPEWRPRLSEVAAAYPEWGPLVARWDECERLFLEEWVSGRAPKLYALMQTLLEQGRQRTVSPGEGAA